MTKEQAAYAAALNAIGSDILDSEGEDAYLADHLGEMRRRAAHSTGPHADCPRCWWTVPCGGPADGEHFADLWEHLIVRHGADPRYADEPARTAWRHAEAEYRATVTA
jgi:hypothetical protein